MSKKINVVLAYYTLYCFQYSLQSVSELLFNFAYFYWYLKKDDGRVMLDTRTQTTIY